MKTDSSIHDFLALGAEAFRVLAGGQTLEGEYRFRSETFKNIERRADGVLPRAGAGAMAARRARARGRKRSRAARRLGDEQPLASW
jgi:hypothetical protein